MRLVELKEDDPQFGYKAGDLFMVEDADYDSDKCVGVKIAVTKIDNSFYKTQLRKAPSHRIKTIAEKEWESSNEGQ